MSLTLAFSPDSSMLAVGAMNDSKYLNNQLGGLVDVFKVNSDLDTVSQMGSVSLADDSSQGQTGNVLALAFSPDSSLLAIAGDEDGMGSAGQVLFWDVAQGQIMGAPLHETDGPISAVAFSPDGRYLVTGTSGGAFGLRVWSMQKRVAVTPILKAHTQAVTSLAFSPDGQQMASGGEDGQVFVWRPTPYSSLSHVVGDGFSGVGQVAYSPDGALMAIGGPNTVTLWDVKTGAKVRSLLIPADERNNVADEIGALAFSPDGKTLAAGDELAQVILWNVSTGKSVGLPLKAHQQVLPGTVYSDIMDLSFSPDSKRLVSSALDGRAILWDVNTLSMSHVFTGVTAQERQAAFSPDGRYLAVAGSGQDMTIWDLTQESVARTIKTAGVWVRAVAFYPHRADTLAALDGNGMITTWDVSTGASIGQPLSDGKISPSVYSPHLVFNTAGNLLLSSHDLTLTMWNMTGAGQGQKYVRALIPEY